MVTASREGGGGVLQEEDGITADTTMLLMDKVWMPHVSSLCQTCPHW